MSFIFLSPELFEKCEALLSSSSLEESFNRLYMLAEDEVAQGSYDVTQKKKLPASGNPQDYFSFGPYWWPDPEQKDGLPYIRRDGEVNPEAREGNSVALEAMAERVHVLTMAWYWSGKKEYAEQAAAQLRAWFLDSETAMTPHLEYAQAIPGVCDGRGIGIIESEALIHISDDAQLLLTSGQWTEGDHAGLKTWFRDYLAWMLSSEKGVTEAKEHNNHGTWFDAQVCCFAAFAGRPESLTAVLKYSLPQRIRKHIEADGSQPHELARTLSWNYSIFNASAFVSAALAARQAGVQLDAELLGNIEQALMFLAEHDPQWLWSEPVHPNQTVLFRARVDLNQEHLKSLTLQLAASTRYYVWVEGRYVGQGPCPSPWPEHDVDSYHLTDLIGSDGLLTIAIIVHHYGVATQSHPDTLPGLWCRLVGEKEGLPWKLDLSAEHWRCCRQGGWIPTRLRRTWATGWMEQFDTDKQPARWNSPSFNDQDQQDWQPVGNLSRPGGCLTPRQTPPLREWLEPATCLLEVARVSNEAPIGESGEGLLARLLDEEKWERLPLQDYQKSWEADQGIRCEPGDSALALLFDLGEEVVGQTEFTVEGESGLVDTYVSEVLREGRPWAFRGNAEYATRWWASGKNPHYRTLNYNGFRYLLIVMRPDQGMLHLKSAGVWRRQADISPDKNIELPTEPDLKFLWDVSIRTLQVSTQETCVDCPTREQALFIADGLWSNLWLGKVFGELSYLEHFYETIRRAQHDNGLMPSALFSSLIPPHFLLDFCLISVWGVDVMRRAFTDRSDAVLRALPVAEKTLQWYQHHMASSGLLEAEPVAIENHPGGRFQIAFIDHPGLWHKFSHPGLERSQQMLALNAYLILAIDAFRASAVAMDYTASCLDLEKLDSQALRRRCHQRFWDEERKYYADCRNDKSGELKGWSEQSQILAVLSGVIAGEDAKALMQRLIADRKDPELCRCTPYFWIYYAEALMVAGLGDQVVPLMQEAWSVMVADPTSTTWWESFEGRDTDSRCHPWAALPAWILGGYSTDFRLCR